MHHDYKVLPFEGNEGPIPGHEIRAHQYDWLKSPVRQVVFEVWDEDAQMSVEVAVHWTRWSQYVRKGRHGYSAIAVICENGQRLHAEHRWVAWRWDGQYEASPLITHGAFKLVTMGGSSTLLEIVGVEDWLYSKRDAEATAKFLSCPWERDNRAFEARMAALNAA